MNRLFFVINISVKQKMNVRFKNFSINLKNKEVKTYTILVFMIYFLSSPFDSDE